MSNYQDKQAWDFVEHFVDPSTGERFGDEETCDVHGQELLGMDEERGELWWGTQRAAWVLYPHFATVLIYGYVGPYHYSGHFVGTAEDVIDYAERHMVKVTHVEDGGEGFE